MARMLWGTEVEMFRAVITIHFAEVPASDNPIRAGHAAFIGVEHAGPFTAKGPATAAITRAKNEAQNIQWRIDQFDNYWEQPRTVTGHVEKSVLAWERIE